MKPPSRMRLEAFDTLRLLCATHIIAYHLLERPLHLMGCPDWLVGGLTSTAGLSTSIFFLLSGFVIAYAHAGEKRFNPFRPMSRSYPLFLLVMLAWYLSLEEFDRPAIHDMGSSLLLISPFLAKFPETPCAPAWAMTVFYLGYLLSAALLPGLCRLPPRRLVLWLATLLAVLTLRGGVSAWLVEGIPPYPNHAYSKFLDYLHIFPALRLPDVLCGTLCGVLVSGRQRTSEKRPLHLRWELTLLAAWLTCAAMGLSSGQLGFGATHGLLAIPLALWLLDSVNSHDGLLAKPGKWLRKNANISLEMYVFHNFIAAMVYRLAAKKFGAETPDVEIGWALAAFVTVAPAAYLMASAFSRIQMAFAWLLNRLLGSRAPR